MSSATPSRPTPTVPDPYGIATACTERLVAGARAIAFWTAALLPLVLLAALTTGTAGRHPSLLAGGLALNAVCAVLGHGHTLE
jgi:VIT1/CCC1 family predicted Fe2+/Mn2+ transporter